MIDYSVTDAEICDAAEPVYSDSPRVLRHIERAEQVLADYLAESGVTVYHPEVVRTLLESNAGMDEKQHLLRQGGFTRRRVWRHEGRPGG